MSLIEIGLECESCAANAIKRLSPVNNKRVACRVEGAIYYTTSGRRNIQIGKEAYYPSHTREDLMRRTFFTILKTFFSQPSCSLSNFFHIICKHADCSYENRPPRIYISLCKHGDYSYENLPPCIYIS